MIVTTKHRVPIPLEASTVIALLATRGMELPHAMVINCLVKIHNNGVFYDTVTDKSESHLNLMIVMIGNFLFSISINSIKKPITWT